MAQKDKNRPIDRSPADAKVKVAAEMPGDREMREKLKETKENDGFPGSCGI